MTHLNSGYEEMCPHVTVFGMELGFGGQKFIL